MTSALTTLVLFAANMPAWLDGRWVDTRESFKDIEISFARSGSELRGSLTERSSNGRQFVAAEFLIRQDGPSLTLSLKEGSIPYGCLLWLPRGLRSPNRRNGPCDYEGAPARKPSRTIYQFVEKYPTEDYLGFNLTERSKRSPGWYPKAIQFRFREGRLTIRSVFGPQHGAPLEKTFMLRRTDPQ
jgi:hypothetical protein